MSDFNDEMNNKTEDELEKEKRRKAGISALAEKIKNVFAGTASDTFSRQIQSYKDKKNQE